MFPFFCSLVSWQISSTTVQLLDFIAGVLHHLMTPMGEDQMLKLFDFQTNVALRLLQGSTPEMRLCGWKQIDTTLALTQRHCWSPKAVWVRKVYMRICIVFRIMWNASGFECLLEKAKAQRTKIFESRHTTNAAHASLDPDTFSEMKGSGSGVPARGL